MTVHPWYLSTGVVLIAAWILIAMGRAFMRGWRQSRERRQRQELLARLAADMRQAARQRQ